MSGIPHKSADTSRGVFVDASGITPRPSSQLLNHFAVTHDAHCLANLIKKSKNDNPAYWHRFTICNESYDCSNYPKNFILKVVTDFVYPCELLPVYVSQKATKVFFLARNCMPAIIKLCKEKLIIPNPDKPESPFKVVIIKDILSINHIPIVKVEPNLVEVIKSRFVNNNVLDLSRFSEDKDLQEFFPLSQPKLLLYVLSLLTKLSNILNKSKGTLKIVLSHNDIKHLPNFETLSDLKLNALDLSHNKIQNVEDIVPLKDLPTLIWLQLDGNPLCCRFDSGITYFLYVKSICRNLRTLDSKRLLEDNVYKRHKTFLCDTRGFNFANQFLEQYFTFYDEFNRPNIASFYSENAMFSMTYHENQNRMGQEFARIKEFKLRSRNLNSLYLKHRNTFTLYHGRDEVLNQLQSLPASHHHPYSFQIDLMTYSKTQAVIHVAGIFKDDFIPPLHFRFSRVFVLTSDNGKEWYITNDQLYLCPTLKYQVPTDWPEQNAPSSFPDPGSNPEHINDLSKTFGGITGMAFEHSKEFLAKNSWNLELALEVFIDEHINEEIPDGVFNKSVEEQEEQSDDEPVIITEDDILPPIETLVVDQSTAAIQLVNKMAKETSVPSKPPVQPDYTGAVSVENENSAAFWNSMLKSIHNSPITYPLPISTTTTVLPLPVSVLDPLYMYEEPEVNFVSQLSSRLSLEEKDELMSPSRRLSEKYSPPSSPLSSGSSSQNFPVDPLSPLMRQKVYFTSQLPAHYIEEKKQSEPMALQSKPCDQNTIVHFPEQFSTVSSTSLPPSSQNSLSDPVSNREAGISVTSPFPRLSPEEEDELAELVMAQPNSSQWSLELLNRLAGLRPPGQARRCRRRLTTLAGKSVRVVLPETVRPIPPKPMQTIRNLPTEQPIDSSELLPSTSKNASIDPRPQNHIPKSSSPVPLSQISLEEQWKLAELVIAQTDRNPLNWNSELRTRLAALRPPGLAPEQVYRARLKTQSGKQVRPLITANMSASPPDEVKVPFTSPTPQPPSNAFQNLSTDSLPNFDKPKVSSSTAWPSQMSLEEEAELAELVLAQTEQSPWDWNPELRARLSTLIPPGLARNQWYRIRLKPKSGKAIKPRIPANINEPNFSLASRVPEMSIKEEEELAELLIAQRNPKKWSSELRHRLAALRPPGVTPGTRYRIRLKSRDGKDIRVNIPENVSILPSMKVAPKFSDGDIKISPSEQFSILAASSSTASASNISPEEEANLTKLVMAQPNPLKWSPELLARLAALRSTEVAPEGRVGVLQPTLGKVKHEALPGTLAEPPEKKRMETRRRHNTGITTSATIVLKPTPPPNKAAILPALDKKSLLDTPNNTSLPDTVSGLPNQIASIKTCNPRALVAMPQQSELQKKRSRSRKRRYKKAL